MFQAAPLQLHADCTNSDLSWVGKKMGLSILSNQADQVSDVKFVSIAVWALPARLSGPKATDLPASTAVLDSCKTHRKQIRSTSIWPSKKLVPGSNTSDQIIQLFVKAPPYRSHFRISRPTGQASCHKLPDQSLPNPVRTHSFLKIYNRMTN